METRDLKSLIFLLEDDDREIQSMVRQKLISLGNPIIPLLESEWMGTVDPILQQRIEQVVHRIQLNTLQLDFKRWNSNDHPSLIEGCLLLCKYRYPGLDVSYYHQVVEQMRKQIWLELNDQQSPETTIRILSSFLYVHKGFTVRADLESKPNSFFLHHLLDTRLGHGMLIAILFLSIAQELDLPVYGITSDESMLLFYTRRFIEDYSDPQSLEKDVLFFIHPYHKGELIPLQTGLKFLVNAIEPKVNSYIVPSSNRIIMKHFLEMLAAVYRSDHQSEQAAEILGIANSLNDL